MSYFISYGWVDCPCIHDPEFVTAPTATPVPYGVRHLGSNVPSTRKFNGNARLIDLHVSASTKTESIEPSLPRGSSTARGQSNRTQLVGHRRTPPPEGNRE